MVIYIDSLSKPLIWHQADVGTTLLRNPFWISKKTSTKKVSKK